MRAGRAPGSGRPAAARGSRVSWPFPYRLLVCGESLGRLTRPVEPQVRGGVRAVAGGLGAGLGPARGCAGLAGQLALPL